MNQKEISQHYKNALDFFKKEKYKESIEIYQMIIKVFTNKEYKSGSEIQMLFNVLTNLGMAYGKINQYKNSLACFRKSIKFAKKNLINPQLISENYLYMGLSYHKLNDKEKELESLKVSATLGNKKAKKLLEGVGIKYFTVDKKSKL